MRPVNLIPPEQRRGEERPLRAGPAAYVIVGLLALALVAITGMVMLGTSISDRESELESLEAREEAARAQADALGPYADFASMAEARQLTVDSLAKTRFDWHRVMEELALVLPEDIWLISARGTVNPNVSLDGAEGVDLRAGIAGPALELIGCGDSQEAVARFSTALEDIDGVTRVGIGSAEKSVESSGSSGGGDSGSSDDCRTREFISKFEIVVAFDEVPPPQPVAAAGPTTPAAIPVAPGETEVAAEQGAAEASAATQTESAQNAAEVVPGVGE